MMKKSRRLTTGLFNQYFKSGSRQHGTYIQLVYSPAPHLKVAVVVGKKVYKKAVDRNRLRRQLYAYAQTHLTDKTGVFIVITKPAAQTVSVAVVIAEMDELLARSGSSR